MTRLDIGNGRLEPGLVKVKLLKTWSAFRSGSTVIVDCHRGERLIADGIASGTKPSDKSDKPRRKRRS